MELGIVRWFLGKMSGSEAGNDCSCVREAISVSDSAEDLVQFRCSVFVLFVQLGVSIQSRYNQQRRMCCVSFQKPSDEEKFLPREISRELMLFGAIVIDAIFFTLLVFMDVAGLHLHQ